MKGKELREKLEGFFRKKENAKFLVVLGIVGMVLVALSGLTGGGEDAAPAEQATGSGYTVAEYQALLEQEIAAVVTKMTGEKNVTVMVTLSSGTEYIYASDKDWSSETAASTTSDSTGSSEKGSNTETYVMVEDANGNQVALLCKELTPTVQGVVVVFPGGENEALASKVQTAVKTALHVTSRRVCVAGVYSSME